MAIGHQDTFCQHTYAVVLAGGRGSRLGPLTDRRAKPAVPFAGKLKIIDFALSNCVNSGVRRIAVLTQYKSQSLIRHVERGWGFLAGSLGEYVDVVPAQQQTGAAWYCGTADAVWQNRDLIAEGPRRLYHLGPERDFGIFAGLDVELVEEFEASAVVCTGLFDDDTETPDDYAEMLQRMRSRNLTMICANPDIAVERGERIVYCGGALARAYGQLGGTTHIAGKPYRPIYDLAVAVAAEIAGHALTRDEILAIGDGVLTDIKGATDAGIDALYISAGIHAAEYGDRANPDTERMRAFLESHGPAPLYTMPVLR